MADELSLGGVEHTTFASFAGVVALPPGRALARFKQITPAQLGQVTFLALNPEGGSRHWLELAQAEHGVQLRVAAHTPYAADVCEMALRGPGVGLVNPITALDCAERGLVVRKLSINVNFACVLALPAGRMLSGTAKQLLSVMRKQLAKDEQRLKKFLNPLNASA
jgi:DNA-binding transcriptional LysR family regulator